MKNANFIPFESVGNIKLGSPLTVLQEQFKLIAVEKDEDDDEEDDEDDYINYDTYEIDGEDGNVELFIDSDSQELDAISLFSECIYMDKNLIGMSHKEFEKHAGVQPDDVEKNIDFGDGEILDFYQYTTLGIHVWAKKGVVINVICGMAENDEDFDLDDED